MASLNRVPIVDVNNDNFREVWPTLIMAMSSSSFVALDTVCRRETTRVEVERTDIDWLPPLLCKKNLKQATLPELQIRRELSGLGNRKKLNAKSIEERYTSIKEAARSRSILSLGISCFKVMGPGVMGPGDPGPGDQPPRPLSYIVQTFNILLLCQEEYVVEPPSLQFLVQHGFDFNKQYEKGLSYYRGDDKETDKSVQSIRHLFTELVSMKKPIVLHNGLVDLMFLYENLYTSLPSSSAMFLAALVDMFPAGIVDTKYITDYEHLMQASYLEYVFRKCLKDNSRSQSGCSMHFPHYPDSYPHVTYRSCNFKAPYDIASNPDVFLDALCINYAGHGWCPKGKFCPKSHDIDLIIDVDSFTAGSKSRKRRRRKDKQEIRKSQLDDDNTKEDCDATIDTANESVDTANESVDMDCAVSNKNGTASDVSMEESSSKVAVVPKIPMGESTHECGGHRAGFDAFMTGFIYAVFQQRPQQGQEKMDEWKNKLYLCCKDYPLTISKSAFAKQSQQHLQKISRIRKQAPSQNDS